VGGKKSPRLRRGLLQSFEFRIARGLRLRMEALSPAEEESCEVRDEVLKSMVAEHPHAGRGDLIGWTDFRSGPAGWTQEQKPVIPSPAIRVQCALSLSDAVGRTRWKSDTGLGRAGFHGGSRMVSRKSDDGLLKQPAQMAARAEQPAREPGRRTSSPNRPEYVCVGRPPILLLDALNTPVQDQAHARMEC